jgi:pyridoxal phosphate enzyme (YggS family)
MINSEVSDFKENFQFVQNRIKNLTKNPVQLVAVSKTKPAETIKCIYDEGHRHFGENYVVELVEKCPKLPKDLLWHFIGHLQSNKIKQILALENLWIIESVDSLSLAQKISKECVKLGRKIRIYIQVNTSHESQKSGVKVDEIVPIYKSIYTNEGNQFQNIELKGLMTIGKLEGDPRGDFQVLADCRKNVTKELNIDECSIDLSMGMSDDYDIAIGMGSTNVRVGSKIFGARAKKEEQKK